MLFTYSTMYVHKRENRWCSPFSVYTSLHVTFPCLLLFCGQYLRSGIDLLCLWEVEQIKKMWRDGICVSCEDK